MSCSCRCPTAFAPGWLGSETELSMLGPISVLRYARTMLGILGGDERCPIARGLDVLGEKWTLMVVRDALLGSTRFSQFQRSLGIPREILTARLASLVESGVLERSSYKPEGGRAREEYQLTEAGRDLASCCSPSASWADRHHPSERRQTCGSSTRTTANPSKPRSSPPAPGAWSPATASPRASTATCPAASRPPSQECPSSLARPSTGSGYDGRAGGAVSPRRPSAPRRRPRGRRAGRPRRRGRRGRRSVPRDRS